MSSVINLKIFLFRELSKPIQFFFKPSDGDEVIIISPYWVSYPDMVLLADAKPVFVDTFQENNFSLDLNAFSNAINEKTKLVIINSPSNPTESLTKSDYEAIGAILENYPNSYVATDDMYEYIHWGEEPFVSFAQACPALSIEPWVNGVSKSYAMTGWRIGYCGGPTDVIGAMKVQSQVHLTHLFHRLRPLLL